MRKSSQKSTPNSSQKNTVVKPEFPTELSSYLGQKGYTIPKSELSETQIRWIKDALTVRPVSNGQVLPDTVFPVYRESPQKIYVPRYFGETQFGKAAEKFSAGTDIDLEFVGEMRDMQKTVIDAYLENTRRGGGGGLLELYCGFGKTICALKLCSLLRKKTLIIVHKEFLVSQWMERIRQFLPSARIGKIQGPMIDIENKDIVIGMLQSLSMKNYDASVFETFGFTIIDEVHHISSQVFSCALFKIVTKYMLGLSATMNRKDGTTSVFKMFIGDVIYKSERKDEYNVIVDAYSYVNGDPKFNEVECDYRGNVAYSTMIVKLCACNDRSEFILKIIGDLLRTPESGGMQIMVLAHNKSILKYLYDAIETREIATVGYYVGGMKESALKTSETKKIIIATYAMAAEALDIKTLNVLVMATPKTDIEQAVGRILRDKHGQPIVVDIVDQHKPFKNQWSKRRAFYNKQNYKIIMHVPQRGGVGAKSRLITDDFSAENDEELERGKCAVFLEDDSSGQET
jgi:superfamily II DNA or RNA helicase